MTIPFILLSFLLSACSPRTAATPVPKGGAQSEEAALASALQQIRVQASDYKISAADLVEITVFQQDELTRKVRVGQNGTISFPLAGTLRIAGLSAGEAEQALSKKLSEFIINPQVTIFIREYGNKKVFLFGQVVKPGSFELPTEARMTVLEAISLAGGFTPIAAPDRTKVMRVVEGKNVSFTVEVSAITKRGEKHKDIVLEPNDIIFVPESFF